MKHSPAPHVTWLPMSRTPYVVLFHTEPVGNEAMENQHNITGAATYLRDFRREQESRRSFRMPPLHAGHRRRSIKRAIYLDRLELRRVVAQIFGRAHSGRVEAAFPSSRRECGCAHPDLPFLLHRDPDFTLRSLSADFRAGRLAPPRRFLPESRFGPRQPRRRSDTLTCERNEFVARTNPSPPLLRFKSIFMQAVFDEHKKAPRTFTFLL